MARGDVRELHETIRLDREGVRSALLESLPAGGKVDRDRLRRILAADRTELFRTEGARDTAEYVSGLFHISKWKAHRWVESAHALEYLPHISAALEAGSLSLDKTVELTRFATPETERKLIRWARGVTVGCIRQRGDEAIKASREEIENAHHNRKLHWWWADQVLYFEGTLPSEQGAAFVGAVDRLAHELPEDPDSPQALFDDDEAPSMDQRRADALVFLATSNDGREMAPPTVIVHVPAEALIGGEHNGLVRNGVVENGPVLAPELVRMLACDSRIQAILEDPSGHPLGSGFETKTPSRDLRRAVLYRDGHTCTFPGCGMKRFLHLHHIEPWPHGPTEYWNLATVCQVHHSLVHKLGWRVAIDDGCAVWHRPLGTRYEPGPAPPDPPLEPQRRKAQYAEAAATAGLDRLIRFLAAA